MTKRSLLSLLGLVLATSVAAQDSDRWMRLGQMDLDPRGDRAVVRLRAPVRVEALVLGMDNASARILAARVQLTNGRVIDWPIRGVIYPSQRTDVFRLPGREERVRRLVLFYETGDRRRRMHRDQDRPWDRDWALRDDDRDSRRGPDDRDRDLDRDRRREDEPRWERNWDPDWERDYGRLRPRVVIWGRD